MKWNQKGNKRQESPRRFDGFWFCGLLQDLTELFRALSNPTLVLGVGEEAVKEKKTVT